MYAKWGSLHKASQLFDKTPQRNVISWNARIVIYAHDGSIQKVLEIEKQPITLLEIFK